MTPSLAVEFLSRYLDLGRFGIMLFFIISGFIVPFSFSTNPSHTRKQTLLHFIVARMFRLYPAYWLALIFAAILTTMSVSNIDYIINFTMIQKLFGVEDAVGVFWTLPIELIFYALCVVLFIGNVLWQPAKIYLVGLFLLACTIGMAVAQYYSSVKIAVTLFAALYSMVLGMQLRFWHDGDNSAKKYARIFIAYYFIALPAICILAYSRDFGHGEIWYRYLISDVTAYLTFAIFLHYKPNVRLSSYLGKISYSIYLFHPVIGFYFIGHFLPLLGIHQIVYAIILTCLIVILSSAVIYRYVELPMIKFGHRLAKM